MGTLLMRQASSYLQEKYRAARLAFTDVSEAELFAEQVTDNNPWSPDTKTMTLIAEASYYFDEYLRIVEVLHKRFATINWKRWRQYYNSLILLEFLITHGSEDFVNEFKSDIGIIKELGTFEHIDTDGVRWGIYMRSKSERLIKLLQGGLSLQEVRSKAIKLTNEIHGFGSSPTSSSSSSSPRGSWTSSFDSYSSSSPSWQDMHDSPKCEETKQSFEQDTLKNLPKKFATHTMPINFLDDNVDVYESLDWNTIQETFTDIDLNDEEEKKVGFFRGFCSKHIGYSPLKNDGEKKLSKSVSDVKDEKKKMLLHQHSMS
ncbi:epsin-3-like [Silene latifolia]|uniref:epsin-3-like n=1 Tax=Silene latifolia TaxID=37657 RepID=UPI003D780D51